MPSRRRGRVRPAHRPGPPGSHRLAGDGGSATAETAIVLPVVVVLLVVLIGAGHAVAAQVTVTEAARSAARYAARGESGAEVTARARTVAGPDAAVSSARAGDLVRVEVSREVVPIPAGPFAAFAVEVSATGTAYLEPHLTGDASRDPP